MEIPPVRQRLDRPDQLLGGHLDDPLTLGYVGEGPGSLLAHQGDDRGGDPVAETIHVDGDIWIAWIAEEDPPGSAPFLD